jgi:hypothetical protein
MFKLQQLAILTMGLDARLCWGFVKEDEPLVYLALSNDDSFILPPYPPRELIHDYTGDSEATSIDTLGQLRRFLNYNTFHVSLSASALYRKMYALVQDEPLVVEVYCSDHWMVGFFEEQPFGLCFIMNEVETKTCVQIPMYYITQLACPGYEEGLTAGLPKLYLYTVHRGEDDPDYG